MIKSTIINSESKNIRWSCNLQNKRAVSWNVATYKAETRNAYISGFDSSGMTANFYQYTRRQNRKKRASPHTHRCENFQSCTSNLLCVCV